MKACDKCKEKIINDYSSIKIKNNNYELCTNCLSHIEEWIKKGPEKKGFKLFQ